LAAAGFGVVEAGRGAAAGFGAVAAGVAAGDGADAGLDGGVLGLGSILAFVGRCKPADELPAD